MSPHAKIYTKVKRIIDILLALFILIISLPIFLLITIFIKIEDPTGKVIFKQKRVGKERKIFWMYKFRSMYANTPDIATHLLEHPESYITKVGALLRRTSLDELPQLINVLKGEMSFIGPRPALWNQYDLIELRQEEGANSIRPGITGLAQISGRDELEIPVKAHLDGEYIRNIGFILDIKIFLKTLIAVLQSKNIIEGKNASKQI